MTIARTHEGKKFKVVSGPEIDIATQKTDFKKAATSSVHPTYAEVQIWESGKGKARHLRFTKGTPKQTPVQQPEQ